MMAGDRQVSTSDQGFLFSLHSQCCPIGPQVGSVGLVGMWRESVDHYLEGHGYQPHKYQ